MWLNHYNNNKLNIFFVCLSMFMLYLHSKNMRLVNFDSLMCSITIRIPHRISKSQKIKHRTPRFSVFFYSKIYMCIQMRNVLVFQTLAIGSSFIALAGLTITVAVPLAYSGVRLIRRIIKRMIETFCCCILSYNDCRR